MSLWKNSNPWCFKVHILQRLSLDVYIKKHYNAKKTKILKHNYESQVYEKSVETPSSA